MLASITAMASIAAAAFHGEHLSHGHVKITAIFFCKFLLNANFNLKEKYIFKK